MKTIRVALLLWLTLSNAFAGWSSFYVTPTGSKVNSGSTADDAALVTFVNGNWDASTGIFIGIGADLSAVTVGMFASIYVDGAEISAFVGRITAFNDTTDAVTVSLLTKTGTAPSTSATGRSMKIGGAWMGPSLNTLTNVAGFPFNFVNANLTNTSFEPVMVWIKGNADGSAAYTATNSFAHASNHVNFCGYTNTIGDAGIAVTSGFTNPVPFNLFTVGANDCRFKQLGFYNNGWTPGDASGAYMVNITGTGNRMERVRFFESARTGLRVGGSGTRLLECEFNRCNRDGANGHAQLLITEESAHTRLFVHNSDKPESDSDGILIINDSPETVMINDSIISHNRGVGININNSGANVILNNCTIASNGNHGVVFDVPNSINGSHVEIQNCIFVLNYGYGVSGETNLLWGPMMSTNSFYSNRLGHIAGVNPSFIGGTNFLSEDPFENTATGDFRLKTTGAGALLRGTARGDFLSHTNIAANYSHRDVGALQNTNSAAGGGTTVIQQVILF